MKIVLDTNVLVSGLINPNGIPAQILNLILNEELIVLYDSRIIEEYELVLSRKKFGFEKEMIDPLLDYIKNVGIFIVAEPIKIAFPDDDDRKFYEIAKGGKAECLITGNTNHFPKNKLIKTPREFMNKYEKKNKEGE
jgi:putative PIN family toxin of toxin-antitoxin system